jgi:hypothetical protein
VPGRRPGGLCGCLSGQLRQALNNYAFSTSKYNFYCFYFWGGAGLHFKENPIFVFLSWELRGLSPNSHIYVSVSDLYIPRIGPHISLQQNRQTDPGGWGGGGEYINLSQIFECRNWETEHYNSVVEITVSFLGIHKWERDTYTRFSPALHLQCEVLYLLYLCTRTYGMLLVLLLLYKGVSASCTGGLQVHCISI